VNVTGHSTLGSNLNKVLCHASFWTTSSLKRWRWFDSHASISITFYVRNW
jgi:hypothetical protein